MTRPWPPHDCIAIRVKPQRVGYSYILCILSVRDDDSKPGFAFASLLFQLSAPVLDTGRPFFPDKKIRSARAAAQDDIVDIRDVQKHLSRQSERLLIRINGDPPKLIRGNDCSVAYIVRSAILAHLEKM